jgi:hypothetical protein
VQFVGLHIGKKVLRAEPSTLVLTQLCSAQAFEHDEQVDHRLRTFISRYADAYADEVDDSFAIHAKLAVEPLAEDEEEGNTAIEAERLEVCSQCDLLLTRKRKKKNHNSQ